MVHRSEDGPSTFTFPLTDRPVKTMEVAHRRGRFSRFRCLIWSGPQRLNVSVLLGQGPGSAWLMEWTMVAGTTIACGDQRVGGRGLPPITVAVAVAQSGGLSLVKSSGPTDGLRSWPQRCAEIRTGSCSRSSRALGRVMSRLHKMTGNDVLPGCLSLISCARLRMAVPEAERQLVSPVVSGRLRSAARGTCRMNWDRARLKQQSLRGFVRFTELPRFPVPSSPPW
jgi:hypothetical protein